MNSTIGQQKVMEAQLVEASKAWSAAFYEGDALAMDDLELQNLIIVDEGEIWRKVQPRSRSTWPIQNVKSYVKIFDQVRLLEDVGLLNGYLTAETNEKNTLVFTEVWKKQSNNWLVATAHFSSQKQ